MIPDEGNEPATADLSPTDETPTVPIPIVAEGGPVGAETPGTTRPRGLLTAALAIVVAAGIAALTMTLLPPLLSGSTPAAPQTPTPSSTAPVVPALVTEVDNGDETRDPAAPPAAPPVPQPTAQPSEEPTPDPTPEPTQSVEPTPAPTP